MVTRLLAVDCEVTTGYRGNRHYSQTKIKLCPDFIGYIMVTRVTRLLSVHCEVMTGYRGNRNYS